MLRNFQKSSNTCTTKIFGRIMKKNHVQPALKRPVFGLLWVQYPSLEATFGYLIKVNNIFGIFCSKILHFIALFSIFLGHTVASAASYTSILSYIGPCLLFLMYN